MVKLAYAIEDAKRNQRENKPKKSNAEYCRQRRRCVKCGNTLGRVFISTKINGRVKRFHLECIELIS